MPRGYIYVHATARFRTIVIATCLLLVLPALAVPAEEGGASPRNRASWALSRTGLPATANYYGVTFGDVDNDGDLDLLSTATSGGLRVYLNDGSGCWTAVSPQPTGNAGSDLRAGDIDNDGDLDVITGSPDTSNGIHVFRGNGTGRFTDITASSGVITTGTWRGIDVGDVNNDGNLDFAATSGYSGGYGIRVYTGDGTGKFVSNSTGLPTTGERDCGIVLVDFNNDGNLDLAACGAAGGACYLGNGGSGGAMSWTSSSTGLTTERYTGVNATDFNNDGSMDIILSSYGSNKGVLAYRNVNNAASWASCSTGLPTNGHYLDVCSADFDSDGYQDLLFGRVAGSALRLFYGNGSGSWSENSTGLCATDSFVGVDAADFNGDGSPDIAAASYSSTGIFCYRNLHSAPPQPVLAMTEPLGNVSWSGGSVHRIAWNASNGTLPYTVNITYSTDGGGNFTGTVATGIVQAAAGANTFDWTVPAIDSTGVRVRVSLKDAMNQTAVRSGPFDLEIDSTPPRVNSTTPLDGAQDCSTNTTVVVRFSERMNLPEAGAAISIIGPGSPSLGTPAWFGEDVVLETAGLQLEAIYTVTVAASALDDSDPGNPMAAPFVFTFNTSNAPVPSVTLLAPQGGETWVAGTEHELRWTAGGGTGELNVSLSYSTVGPGGPWTPIADNETNDGSFNWTVPDAPSANCFITATASDGFSPPKTASDQNDAPFTIKEAPVPLSVNVTSPAGGETWLAGSAQNISWSSSGGNGNRTVLVESSTLSPDGPWTALETGGPDDGSLEWTVPNTPSRTCYVRVTATDSYDPPQTANDTSPAFVIKAAPVPLGITLNSPNGGENWTVGTVHSITWASSGGNGEKRVGIRFSQNGTAGPWTDIAANGTDDGVHSWTVPNLTTEAALIEVSVTDSYDPPQSASDQSNAVFRISRPAPPADTFRPVVAINEPARNAEVNGTVPVNAGATDNVGVVRMTLLIDGVEAANSTNGSITFLWATTRSMEGVHTITARAWDAAGNEGNASVTVTVKFPEVAKPKPPAKTEKSFLESYWWVLAAMAAFIAMAVVVAVLMRRKPPEPIGQMAPEQPAPPQAMPGQVPGAMPPQ
jgi:hypothetical protein